MNVRMRAIVSFRVCDLSYIKQNKTNLIKANRIKMHKRLKRTLFIRIKHNVLIFRVIPFIKLQNNS